MYLQLHGCLYGNKKYLALNLFITETLKHSQASVAMKDKIKRAW